MMRESALQKPVSDLRPEYADGYLLLGILQAEKGKKEEAKGNLLKAKELGDTRVDEYLKKYKLN